MAAFYAFRHVELDRVGCGKRKVLKPPGGGSSDIFGNSSGQCEQAPARVNKKYASNFTLGGGDFAEDVARKQASIDSNDGSSTSSQPSTSNGTPENSEPNTPRSGTPLLNGPIAYHDTQEAVPTPASRPQGRRPQGNPVTGEGYNGSEAKKEETPRRQRVPPGGFSSKLW